MDELLKPAARFCPECRDLVAGRRTDGEHMPPDVEALHIETDSDETASFPRCRHCGARIYDTERPT